MLTSIARTRTRNVICDVYDVLFHGHWLDGARDCRFESLSAKRHTLSYIARIVGT